MNRVSPINRLIAGSLDIGIFIGLIYFLSQTLEEIPMFVTAVIFYVIIQSPFWINGRTMGKWLLRLKVVNSRRKPIGFWIMLFREVVLKFFSILFVFLGVFWFLLDGDERNWHDKILNVDVVKG